MKRFKALQVYVAFMMLILSVFLFAGCGSSDEAALVAAQFDNVLPGTCGEAGPKVNSSYPANNTESVAIETTIMAYFSEAMDPTTIAYTNQADPQVVTFTLRDNNDTTENTEGTVAMDVTNAIATFTPTIALHGSSWYTVTITKYAKNAGGTALGCNYQWEFKTVAP